MNKVMGARLWFLIIIILRNDGARRNPGVECLCRHVFDFHRPYFY